MTRANVAAFLAGLVFVLGLGVAGMTDPTKVLAFLDVGGKFDPSLMAVMAGGVAVGLVGFRLALRRPRPVLADRFQLPQQTRIDGNLVVGSILFGIGWGLSGYCPGPALASVVTGAPGALLFVGSMLVGMAAFGWYRARSAERAPVSEPDPVLERVSPAE